MLGLRPYIYQLDFLSRITKFCRKLKNLIFGLWKKIFYVFPYENILNNKCFEYNPSS